MAEHERAEGTATNAAPGTGPDAGRTRGRTIAVLSGVVAVLMVIGIVVVVRNDPSEPGLARLPFLRDRNAAGAETLTAAADSMLPAAPIRFELAGPLPELATTGPVWRFQLPPLDEPAVRDLARGLGVDDPATVRRDGEGWVVSGAERELSAFPSGRAWSVGVGMRVKALPQSSPPSEGAAPDAPVSTTPGDDSVSSSAVEEPSVVNPPANLPSAAEATRIARDRLTAAGVIDDSWAVEVLDAGSVSIAVACAPESPCPEPAPAIVTARSIVFTDVVDGTPVEGLSWGVDVGDGGVITNIYGTLTELELLGEYPLRTVQDAYVALSENPYGDGPVPLDAAESGGGAEPGVPEPAPADDTPREPALSPDSPVESPPIGEAPTPIDPEPVVVTITGVALATTITYGVIDGGDVMFVVPAYRFLGRYADGTDFEMITTALDPAVIAAR